MEARYCNGGRKRLAGRWSSRRSQRRHHPRVASEMKQVKKASTCAACQGAISDGCIEPHTRYVGATACRVGATQRPQQPLPGTTSRWARYRHKGVDDCLRTALHDSLSTHNKLYQYQCHYCFTGATRSLGRMVSYKCGCRCRCSPHNN